MSWSDEEDILDNFYFQHAKDFSYSHCSEYSPVFVKMPFFHDGVEEAFLEAVSKSTLF